jgi:hypothetical protein
MTRPRFPTQPVPICPRSPSTGSTASTTVCPLHPCSIGLTKTQHHPTLQERYKRSPASGQAAFARKPTPTHDVQRSQFPPNLLAPPALPWRAQWPPQPQPTHQNTNAQPNLRTHRHAHPPQRQQLSTSSQPLGRPVDRPTRPKHKRTQHNTQHAHAFVLEINRLIRTRSG